MADLPLSIVIPAYAEARYLGGTLAAIEAWGGARGRPYEVVVVTADAPDDTRALVRAALPRFAHTQHLEPGPKVGKGRDVRLGMLAARGEQVVFMDADLATPLDYLAPLLARLDDGADVAIGIRDLATIHADALRRFTSLASNWLVQRLILPGITDTQCGFKGFRRAAIEPLFARLVATGWGFDFEVLAQARRLGLRIDTLPVPRWKDPKGTAGLAGENVVLAQARTLAELGRVTWRRGRR